MIQQPVRPTLPQTVIDARPNQLGRSFAEVWRYRELLWMLAGREISLRYRQTIIGVAWVVLQPLLTTFIFTLIFGLLMRAPSDGSNYTVFTYVGLLPWNLFAQSLQRSGVSLTKDLKLITKIFFPRLIIPLSATLSTLVDFAVSFGLLFVLLLAYSVPLTWRLLTIPLLLALCLLLSAGVGVFFAALNVYYRDFTYVLPFVLQVWMYASPLAYSAKLIPPSWGWVYALNPLVGIIGGFRWAVFAASPFPGMELLYSGVCALAVSLAGFFVFQRLEKSFADVI